MKKALRGDANTTRWL